MQWGEMLLANYRTKMWKIPWRAVNANLIAIVFPTLVSVVAAQVHVSLSLTFFFTINLTTYLI